MDINEIKDELTRRGWTQADLAEKIGYSHGSIRKLLSGERPLTESTAKHIELLFATTREAVFVFSVNIPECKCRSWVPSWDTLKPSEKERALRAVISEIIERYADKGFEYLTEADKQAMSRESLPGGDCLAADDSEE